jgi:uncharacterized membrane protein YraQ (UPF0718 family)
LTGGVKSLIIIKIAAVVIRKPNPYLRLFLIQYVYQVEITLLRRKKMDFILNLALLSVNKVFLTLSHNWPYLVVSILIAASMKLFLHAEQVSAFLNRNLNAGIVAATTAAVATPLCSCGTTAVLLGMMASLMPWAPMIAFMVSSPLTSPAELVYSAGLFGWPFAITFFLASIILGLGGGAVGTFFDRRGWLKNQTRMKVVCSSCDPKPQITVTTCGCSDTAPKKPGLKVQDYVRALSTSGKQLLVMFIGFAFIGYFLNGLIPQEWISIAFGSGNAYSVPLAATLGLPFYISSEASLPLIRAMMDAGMSQGSAMAFLISGSGTSIGAIAGALTIARWRVIALVIATLWIGAIVFGIVYDFLIATGLV